jgi:hypothetical protein
MNTGEMMLLVRSEQAGIRAELAKPLQTAGVYAAGFAGHWGTC